MSTIFNTMFEKLVGMAGQLWPPPDVTTNAWIEAHEEGGEVARCKYEFRTEWSDLVRTMTAHIPEILDRCGMVIRPRARTAEESLALFERLYFEEGIFQKFALGEEVQVGLLRAAKYFEIREGDLDNEVAKNPAELDYLSRLEGEMIKRHAEAEKRMHEAKAKWDAKKSEAFLEAKNSKKVSTGKPPSNEEAKANSEIAPDVLKARDYYYECWQEAIDLKRGVDIVHSDVQAVKKKGSQLYVLVQLKEMRERATGYLVRQEED